MFEAPPETKWNVLSLGAGVQSSCMALMAAKGEITPAPDFVIFADTKAEPTSVYEWLDWLEKELPFPVIKVEEGDLTAEQLRVRIKKRDGSSYIKNIIPTFGKYEDGKITAALGRSCTADYKIKPIIKKMRELCEIKRGQKDITVTQWIGISWDEMQRMRYPRHKWIQNRYPLIERKMSRHHCIKWMADNGYPEPPRSACYYCPFHSDDEWRRLRNDEPEFFKKAIEFDTTLRESYIKHDKGRRMETYLHESCKPLGEVDFDSDEDRGQETFDFASECEGMCGL